MPFFHALNKLGQLKTDNIQRGTGLLVLLRFFKSYKLYLKIIFFLSNEVCFHNFRNIIFTIPGNLKTPTEILQIFLVFEIQTEKVNVYFWKLFYISGPYNSEKMKTGHNRYFHIKVSYVFEKSFRTLFSKSVTNLVIFQI